MNERIKQLAIHAKLSYIMTADKPFIDEDLQKFAELIIRECTNRANQYIKDCGEVASLPEHILKEHFGVKE